MVGAHLFIAATGISDGAEDRSTESPTCPFRQEHAHAKSNVCPLIGPFPKIARAHDRHGPTDPALAPRRVAQLKRGRKWVCNLTCTHPAGAPDRPQFRLSAAHAAQSQGIIRMESQSSQARYSSLR